MKLKIDLLTMYEMNLLIIYFGRKNVLTASVSQSLEYFSDGQITDVRNWLEMVVNARSNSKYFFNDTREFDLQTRNLEKFIKTNLTSEFNNKLIKINDVKEFLSEYICPSFEGIVTDVEGEDIQLEIVDAIIIGKRRSGILNSDTDINYVDWYIGVPFAKPPIGSLRFKKTSRVERWKGVIRCVRFGWSCPQVLTNPTIMSHLQKEDCLYLNIYAPAQNISNGRLYPVMVYIHGGSYKVGSGSEYRGDVLAQLSVVVVTFNYRLGIFGFLSSKEHGLSGNFGLWDQIEALKWVQRNIRSFGGDPTQVTIFGNSAGGASVGILLASPRATKGLFSRAILQSGTPLSFWALNMNESNTLEQFNTVAHHFGCADQTKENLLDCLTQANWTKIYDIDSKKLSHISMIADIVATVDGDIISRDISSSDHSNDTSWRETDPLNLFYSRKLEVDSVMIGGTTDEWSLSISSLLYSILYEEDFRKLRNKRMSRQTFEASVKHFLVDWLRYDAIISDLVISNYSQQVIAMQLINEEDVEKMYYTIMNELMTDIDPLAPTILISDLIKQNPQNNLNLYVYRIAYKIQDLNFHELELNYLFGSPFKNETIKGILPIMAWSDQDRNFSKQMMSSWTNFAKFGNPSSRNEQPSWPEYDLSSRSVYVMDWKNWSHVETHCRATFMSFWNDYVPIVMKQLRSSYAKANATNAGQHFYVVFIAVLSISIFLL